MAAKVTKNLTARFIADTSKWSKNFAKVRTDVRSLGNLDKKVRKQFNGIGNSTNQLGKKIGTGKRGLIGRFGQLKSSIGSVIPLGALGALAGYGAAAFAVYKIIRKIISVGSEAEKAITKLTVLMKGNAKAALATYEKVIEFAAKTPKTSAQLMEGVLISQTYGFNAIKKGVLGMKETILTLATGMSAITGQTIPEAMTALMRADLALLDKYGGTARKAYQTASKAGRVGTDAFRRSFISLMAKVPEYMNAAAAESKTLGGLWSTIVDNIQLAFLYMSGVTSPDKTSFWNILKGIIGSITTGIMKFMKVMKPVFIEIGNHLSRAFTLIWNTIKMIWYVGKPLWILIGATVFAIFIMGSKLLGLIANIFGLIAKTAKVLWEWLDSILGISNAIKVVIDYAGNMITKVKIMGVFLKNLFTGMLDKAKEWFDKVPNFLRRAKEAVTGFLFGDETEEKKMKAPTVQEYYERGGRGAPGRGGALDLAPGRPVASVNNYDQRRASVDHSSSITNIFSPRTEDWEINHTDTTGHPLLGVA